MKIKFSTVSAIAIFTLTLSGCSGIAFSKDGESDAKAACAAVSNTQGSDVSIADGLAGFIKGSTLATQAASANDDYQELASAMRALNESMISGSQDMAQSAWANVARICNAL